MPYCDLDHLTIGADAQVLCFHSKYKKFHVYSHNGHEQRTFMVETCSRLLGKTITFVLQRIMGRHAALMVSKAKDGIQQQNEQDEIVTPLNITTSHTSQLGMVLKRFLRRELGMVCKIFIIKFTLS